MPTSTIAILAAALAIPFTALASPAAAWFEDSDYIHPGQTLTYTEWFTGGSVASASVCGDWGTDIDLFVYDEHGQFIASSESASECEYLEWYPLWTGPFSIDVYNYGSTGSGYYLTVQ